MRKTILTTSFALLLTATPWALVAYGLNHDFIFFPLGLILIFPFVLILTVTALWSSKGDPNAAGFWNRICRYPEMILGVINCVVGVFALMLIYVMVAG